MKQKYFIQLNQWMDKLEFEGTIEEAKAYADENISYNQQDCSIFDVNNIEVCRRNWYGVAPEDFETDIISFGDFGHYSEWIDV